METRQFWIDTAERVAWTFVQALAAAGMSDGVLDLTQMSWKAALGIASGAALVALAKCMGVALLPPKGTPATVPETAGRHARREL